MIIVTGGAGFVGSNTIKALNERGREDILVVDNLTEGAKYVNLADRAVMDYWDKDSFLVHIKDEGDFSEPVEAIFHQGACSTTTEWDGRYLMQNNFEYSKMLLHYCLNRGISFIYASSAAVYGSGKAFKAVSENEVPLNAYGYSKLLFDRYVRRTLANAWSQIVGLRYFNVYGPREAHKGSMASVAFHLYHQVTNGGRVRLFAGTAGYGDGEQRRDFVHVDDVVAVALWFLDNPEKSGIFNVGTGRSATFNELAQAVVGWYGSGSIEYFPLPTELEDHYQSFTEADISGLRDAGCETKFRPVEEGVPQYMEWLAATSGQRSAASGQRAEGRERSAGSREQRAGRIGGRDS